MERIRAISFEDSLEDASLSGILKRKGGGNRLTLHVTQIGTVDRNGDCSMKRNGALRNRFAPPNGYSMKRFTR